MAGALVVFEFFKEWRLKLRIERFSYVAEVCGTRNDYQGYDESVGSFGMQAQSLQRLTS